MVSSPAPLALIVSVLFPGFAHRSSPPVMMPYLLVLPTIAFRSPSVPWVIASVLPAARLIPVNVSVFPLMEKLTFAQLLPLVFLKLTSSGVSTIPPTSTVRFPLLMFSVTIDVSVLSCQNGTA